MRVQRSMLFVPAARPDRVAKAAASDADAVCIDLEDSITADEKASCRANVVAALRDIDFGNRTRIVRVNGMDTPFAHRDIVEVVEGAGDRIDVLMIPKVSSADDLMSADRLLGEIESSRGLGRRIGVEAQIETAAGFVWLREISRATGRLEALVFGPGDYSASMGMPSSSIGALDDAADYPGHRWHAPMHGIVAHARAAGLRAVDGPFAAFKDADAFERSCRIARSLGFDGKQCIHPTQLAIANRIFSPTSEEIAHAERVARACDDAAAAGRGAATLDGLMIDAASLRMARSVLDRRDRMRGSSLPTPAS
jgi:malyl-CoA/(S)-citramalyl-CoA lyase